MPIQLLALTLSGGCSWFDNMEAYRTPSRYRQGYTIILPGIEGKSYLNRRLAKGLARGGVTTAIEIHDWTIAGGLTAAMNLRYEARNRREADEIARKIIAYQDRYPNRPIFLIGHSGGGGLAVYVLEALPHDCKVHLAMLLAPALAPDYDLTNALDHTEHGIWNFYSSYDVGWLGAGTTVVGTMDGRHTRAAGAVGFSMPGGLSAPSRDLYARLLHQQSYTRKMAESGHDGGHTDWANSEFAARWLAPILISHSRPSSR